MYYLVILKAAHIFVSGNTVRTEETCTITASCNSIFLCLATSTQHPHCTYIIHVHHIHGDHIQWQLPNCSNVGLLLTHWANHNFTVTRSLSHCLAFLFVIHKFLKTRSTQYMKAMKDAWLLIATSAWWTGKLILLLSILCLLISWFIHYVRMFGRCCQWLSILIHL